LHSLQRLLCAWAYPMAAASVFVATALAEAADLSVPYVPTPQVVVDRMLQMGKVGPRDYLIDLGSGDGRIVVTAAKKYGARGFGVDLNPQRIEEANENARKAGVTDRVAFYQRDLFETDLGDASVITMYLLPNVNLQLRPKLLELKPGVRIVSHDFSMNEWKPDEFLQMDAPGKYGGTDGQSDLYLWIVPAKAAGTWRWQLPLRARQISYELALQQTFQVISGTIVAGGKRVPIEKARLRGSEIAFSFTAEVDGAPLKHDFSGRMEGDNISGTATLSGAKVQSQVQWDAKRAAKSANRAARVPHRG